jgi:hypothetical protein
MRTAIKVTSTILAAAALVGLSGAMSPAMAAQPEAVVASAHSTDVTDQTAAVAFSVKSWSDKEWVVSKTFATDGSGHDTRVGPFLPEDSVPAVGSVLWFNQTMTVKVDGSSWGTHGVSVLLYNKSNPKETIQLWFVRGFFSSHVDMKFPDNMLVQSYRGDVNIWDVDW